MNDIPFHTIYNAFPEIKAVKDMKVISATMYVVGLINLASGVRLTESTIVQQVIKVIVKIKNIF